MKKSVTHSLALATAMAVLTLSPAAQAEVTGNIGVYSKYVLRGITNNAENDGVAVQGGLDWSHSSGVYLGYWGSNLDYGITRTSTTNTGFENDIYGGYGFKAGPVDLSFGLIQYLYTQAADSDGTELVGSVGAGPVKGGFKYLLKDVAWGNKGDTYLTLDFKQALPADYELNATLGYYLYADSGEFEPLLATTESSGFRHLDIKLSHAIGGGASGALGKTGFTPHVSLTYVVGGEDRQGVKQGNAIVLAFTTGF